MSRTIIPLVDLTPFTHPTTNPTTPAARHAVATDLVAACHRYGFVTITGHGLPPALLKTAFDTIHHLFALPSDDKLKAPHPASSTPHRGYSAPGVEKVYTREQATQQRAAVRRVVDFKESYDIGSQSNTTHTNIWLPEALLPGFRTFSLHLFWALDALAARILDAFALGLGLAQAERVYLCGLSSGHNNQLRYLHYPPVSNAMAEEGVAVTRMGAHTDWSLFTMLFQEEGEGGVGGLELEDPCDRGTFVKAGSWGGEEEEVVVLNVGDMLERVTNGYLPSALHRVALPDMGGVSEMTPARFSMPYFCAPDDDKMVRTLGRFVQDGERSQYEDVMFRDYEGVRARHSYVDHMNKDDT